MDYMSKMSADDCRSLRGNVDRNIDHWTAEKESAGRSLRGNVDRNLNNGAKEVTDVLSFPTWERG